MSLADLKQRYKTNVDNSYGLFLFNLLYLVKVIEYSVTDGKNRLSKHLPTEADKTFTAKLFDNELVKSLQSNSMLQEFWDKYKLPDRVDTDTVRSLYTEFSKKAEYKAFLEEKSTDLKGYQQILLQLYKFCNSNEVFNEVMDDFYWSWDDDKSLVVGTIKKTIKALPEQTDFFEKSQPDEEVTMEFGQKLLINVVEQDKELLGIIEPTLKNWDADRVAVMDMILIKMALSELISFPTIPTKVTLNEFVEISKLYSTDKSKDFINGILDRLMKKLNKEGKIHKTGRGLME